MRLESFHPKLSAAFEGIWMLYYGYIYCGHSYATFWGPWWFPVPFSWYIKIYITYFTNNKILSSVYITSFISLIIFQEQSSNFVINSWRFIMKSVPIDALTWILYSLIVSLICTVYLRGVIHLLIIKKIILGVKIKLKSNSENL